MWGGTVAGLVALGIHVLQWGLTWTEKPALIVGFSLLFYAAGYHRALKEDKKRASNSVE